MTAKTLTDIAAHVGGVVQGDGTLTVDHVAGLDAAGPGALTFFAVPRHATPAVERYAALLAVTRATAAIVPRDIATAPCALIQVDNPDLAFSLAVRLLVPPPPRPETGVHPTAVVAAGVRIGQDVAIGAGTVVEPQAVIGARTILFPGVYVGAGTTVGADCCLYPGVVLYHQVRLGDRVILHANAVVGADGFGYAWDGHAHQKIPQIGTVVIEDDVEIGACTTVDRARFGETRIGRGTKLDNLIQIAHNVRLGAHCAFASQVGISGSTEIGNGVLMGGQAGTAGHVKIGDGAVFSARAGVSKNIPAGVHYTGYPARPHAAQLDEWGNIKALPRLRATVRELERRIAGLEARLKP